MSNTALVLGVGHVAAPAGTDGEPEPGSAAWPPLTFVYDLVPRLARSLKDLGYHTTQVVDPDLGTLRSAVEQAMGADGGHSRVLHLISHGFTDPRGDPTRVDIVPAAGRVGIGTNVSEWVSSAETLRRPTLFLLDLCRAGRAARLPFLLRHAGRDTCTWVIAASGTEEDAFDGRFTRAAADVLRELARTGLGADPTRRHVAFSAVARHIRQRVESAHGLPQTVLATAMDLGLDEPDLPFFPNPRFREDTGRQALLGLSPPLRAFVDDLATIEGSDAGHFTDRAGRHFVGRRAQLRLLAPWLDDDGAGGLRVVTGSPGAGKSALLGALVCAAHTELAAVVPHVRARIQAQDPLGCPSRHPQLAAVHARQRTLDDVVAAVVRQLRLPVPPDGWQPATLPRTLGEMPAPPPIVIDALDEAIDPRAICAELLLPLARATRPDGNPVCRLLVGMRPWRQFTELREAALAQDGLVDLDAVDPAELRADLDGYLASALADLPNYAARGQRALRMRLATAVAAALTSPAARADEWGGFLVGSLLTGYLQNRPPARTPAEAERMAAQVPTTLPGVLDLDLELRSDAGALRAVLSAVAHAKGDGMPAEVVAFLAAGPGGDADTGAVQRLLDEARFYLRTGVERDGTTLYRLFHQGLTDHLRRAPAASGAGPAAPRGPGAVLDRLLRGITSTRDAAVPGPAWHTAPAYLLRHAIDHAADAGREDELVADPEFLVHADPDTLVPALDRVRGEAARSAAAVYRASIDLHRTLPPEPRRRLLAIDAARYQDRPLFAALRERDSSGGWLPRWATGFGTTRALRRTLPHPQGVEALACTALGGTPVAVTGGYDGVVRVWNLSTGRLHAEPLTGHAGPVSGIACATLGGRPVVASTGQDQTVRICFLDTGRLHREAIAGGGYHNRLVAAAIGGRPAIVVVGPALRALDIESGDVLYDVPTGLGWGHTAADDVVMRGRHVIVAGGDDGTLRVWDAQGGECLRELHTGSAIHAIACATVLKRAVAAVNQDDDANQGYCVVTFWDLAGRRPAAAPLPPRLTGLNSGLACVRTDGRLIAVTSQHTPGIVRLWDVFPRRAHPPLTGHVAGPHAITATIIDGEPRVVTGSRDGTARVWDLPAGQAIASRRSRKAGRSADFDTLREVTCTAVGGRDVAVTAGDSGVRTWDLATGTPAGPLMAPGAMTLASVTVDGRAIAVTTGGVFDPAVRTWDLATGEELLDRWDGPPGPVACATVGGRPVVVRAGASGFELRDIRTGQIRRLSSGPPDGQYALACTTAGGRPVAVTGRGSGVLRAWDLETGQPLTEQVQAHKGELCAISCAAAGGRTMILTGYFGGATSGREPVEALPRVWDLSRNPRGTALSGTSLRGHTGWVTSTAFTVRGGRPFAVTGGRDSVVKLWDVGGTCLRTLRMPSSVASLAVARSGELAAVTDSGDLVVFEPAWEEL